MKIAGDYRFDAPREQVWASLLDPEVLARVMPGCEKLELVDENTYEGVLKIKVGPVQGNFQGKVRLSDIVAPTSYSMEVDGRGAPGFVKADAQVTLEDDGDGTLMRYDSDARVGGRIASVGQRLLDSSARAIVKQSLEGLGSILAARAPAGGGGEDPGDGEAAARSAPAPAPAPPSQAEFAARVAKEVAADLVPKWVWIAAAVVLVLILLYLLL